MTTLPKQTLLGSRLTNFDQLPNSALLTVNEIVILANRTYPKDDNAFSKSNIRTRMQALIYEALID